jgi:hypothetical protein
MKQYAGLPASTGVLSNTRCILDDVGKVKGERAFSHGGAGLVALCDWLVSVAGSSGSVAVAIEVPTTPAPLHEAQSSREQWLLFEQSGKESIQNPGGDYAPTDRT